MSEQFAPQRLSVAERVRAIVTCLGDFALLSADELATGEVVAQGDLIIRYGITYLGKPHLSIVPDLVVADYGELLNGEEAWDFLMQSGHLYPRADVCGRRNDGLDDMPVIKQLDLDHAYDVFVYQQAADRRPFAQLSALIAEDRAVFPARLRQHLPGYDSLRDWRAHV